MLDLWMILQIITVVADRILRVLVILTIKLAIPFLLGVIIFLNIGVITLLAVAEELHSPLGRLADYLSPLLDAFLHFFSQLCIQAVYFEGDEKLFRHVHHNFADDLWLHAVEEVGHVD
jgi:hypothetical protein